MGTEMNSLAEKLNSNSILIQENDFPPLPEVAWKVLEITSDLYRGTQALEEIISSDQALTARLLRIANSDVFGVQRAVVTVAEAAIVLGNRRLRSVVIAASLDGVLKKTPAGRLQWEHSLAVGLAARELAKEIGYADLDEAFVAGLMHDIGKNILDGQYPDSYGRVLELIAETGQETVEAERLVLGCDHCEAGQLLADVWNLSEPLAEVVRLHHTPEEAEVDSELCHIVHLADSIVVKLGIGPIGRPNLSLAKSPSRQTLQLQPKRIEQLANQIVRRLVEEKKKFGMA